MRHGKNLKIWVGVCASLLAMACPASGRTITVDDDGPADFSNIQAAINDSSNGDIIVVHPGTYTGSGNRDINFLGKAITVRSKNGPQNCVIDCQGTKDQPHRAFYIRYGEQEDSILDGFTITNGYAVKLGGGVFCENASPTIRNCIFRDNTSAWKGGAIQNAYSRPIIVNCLFQNNVAKWGGGLHTGGVYGSAQGPIMVNCTFTANLAWGREGGGGVSCDSTGKTTLTNCVLWGNICLGAQGLRAQADLPNPVVNYCCIEGLTGSLGGVGNTGADAMLAPDRCHLLPESPCIDAGDPNRVIGPNEVDIDGQPRLTGTRIDIGADERDTSSGSLMAVYPEAVQFVLPFGETVLSAKSLFIWNVGGGTVGWHVTEDSNWLDVWPTSGESQAEVDEVILNVDSNELVSGEEYATTVTVSAIGQADAVKDIEVGLYLGRARLVPAEYPTIQAAIDASSAGDSVVIADGNYTGQGNTNLDFLGKAITVRSENGPNNCVIDCQGLTRGFRFHTLENSDSVLEDVTIKNGNADLGGGILCKYSSPTIRSCIIKNNSATIGGGGICCDESGNPTISDCVITWNSGYRGGGAACLDGTLIFTNCLFAHNVGHDRGGGLYSDRNFVIVACTFYDNASDDGGAVSSNLGSPEIWGCTFTNNRAVKRGGGMQCHRGSPVVINSTFSGNCAGEYGGGLMVFESGVRLINCTLHGNWAGRNGGGICNLSGTTRVANSILWGNIDSEGIGLSGQLWGGPGNPFVINYSCVQAWTGSLGGTGNIGADPCLAVPGHWDPNGTANDPTDDFWVDGDYHLLADSPCIDAGDPNHTAEPNETDLDGNPRIVDGNNDGNLVVDMGAYEYFVPPIEVEMRFTPQALNPQSKGNWVKAHLVLPEEFGVEDVDANRPAVIEPGGIESEYMNVFLNEDGLVEIEAAFSRAGFCEVGVSGEAIEVMAIGSFTSGQQFYGTDTVKITNNILKYLGALASHWLDEQCGKPDWCGGLDVNQDSAVDFGDYALFDGCCVEVVKE